MTRAGSGPGDRALHARRRLVAFGAGVFTYILARVLATLPAAAETLSSRVVGPGITHPLAWLTSLVPLSLAEWLTVGYVAWRAVATARAWRAVRGGRRSAKNAAAVGSLVMARDLGVAVTLFYVMWGVTYSRPPLSVRLGWPGWDGVEAEELARLASQTVAAGNTAYLAIHDTADAREPTRLPGHLRGVEEGLNEGWRRVVDQLDLPPVMAGRYGRVKLLLSSPIFARFGITGFFFPFTAEANVRRGVPAVALPHSMAHEQAHQRGVGSEAEASFLGYLAAARAPDSYARYAGIMFAQRQLVNALYSVSYDDWLAVRMQRLPGVQRDLLHLANYFRQFRGVGTTIGAVVNDRYLRANRVPGGILSYSLSVRLLITYAREHEGRLIPPAPTRTALTVR